MRRKILYISGTRADYGLMREVLFRIQSHPELSLKIAVTGMHLMEEFGKTEVEIQNDGFSCITIDAVIEDDNKKSMASFIGVFIQKLVKEIEKYRPDFILILGDRAEMLAGAIVGSYLSIPVVHLHGGEVTSTVDDLVRHAITKLAHIHFPATEESAHRIISMGENPKRVFVVGAPGLDQIFLTKLSSRYKIMTKYNLDLKQPFFLVVQHPVTLEVEDAQMQIKETLDAIMELNIQTIIVYPNADSGGRSMIEIIKKFEKYPNIQTFKNLPHSDFLSLLKYASALIGNSSSGIIESPSFGTPVVNIGTRQQGRQRGDNVIDSIYDKTKIIDAILKATKDKKNLTYIRKCKNLYGDGSCGEKVVEIMSTIVIDDQLLQKKMMY